MKEKIILAYSSELDTSVIIPWLKENYDCEIIAVCINVDQDPELIGLEERVLNMDVSPLETSDTPTYITLTFDQGILTHLNQQPLSPKLKITGKIYFNNRSYLLFLVVFIFSKSFLFLTLKNSYT